MPRLFLVALLGFLLALLLSCAAGGEPVSNSATETATETEPSLPAAIPTVPRQLLPTPTAIPTPTPTEAPTSTPVPTPTPTPIPGPTLIFSQLDWRTAQLQNSIARFILEHGYGYRTDHISGEYTTLQDRLTRGDTHITMEIWLPTQQDWFDVAIETGEITRLGKSLGDNWESAFVIPQYVADENSGLRTAQDLKKPEYRELFVTPSSNGKARLFTCLKGWTCEVTNRSQIAAYGLQDSVMLEVPANYGHYFDEIRGAFDREEAILFYLWGPTLLAQELETLHGGFKVLEEPEHTDACWRTNRACGYPTTEVYVVVRSELLQSAPDAIEFLRRWEFGADSQLAVEGYVEDAGVPYLEAAKWFLRNTTEWQTWVTPEARDKVLAALAA